MHVTPKDKKESRYDQLKRDKSHWLEFPEIEDGLYLLEYITELGFASSDGSPLAHSEIESWKRLTGVELTAWEAGTIRELSQAYAGQFSNKDVNAPPPFDSKPPTKEEVGKKLKNAFNALRK